MKKIILPMLLALTFVAAKPINKLGQAFGMIDSLKYVEYLSSLEAAIKGDPQGFVRLINMASTEIDKVDFSKLTVDHIDNITSFIKSGLNSEDTDIKRAVASMAKGLIFKLRSDLLKDPKNEIISKLLEKISIYPLSSEISTEMVPKL